MDHADALSLGIPGTVDLDSTPPETDLTFILQQGTGEDLHQGAFAGSIFTDQGMDFAACNGEIDRGQGLDTGKGFADALHLQECGVFSHVNDNESEEAVSSDGQKDPRPESTASIAS